MHLLLKILIALLVLILILVAVFMLDRERALRFVFGEIDTQEIDFKSLELSHKPNQFLVCPEGYCAATPMMESPVFDLPVKELIKRWDRVVSAEERIELASIVSNFEQYTYIQRSKLMRYPDSITVRFIKLNDAQSTLAIYSRSHYGYDDLGVNEKRIRNWLGKL